IKQTNLSSSSLKKPSIPITESSSPSMDNGRYRGYVRGTQIASTVLRFATVAACSVVFVFALCKVHRRQDPTRSWVTLYKVAFGLFVVGFWLSSIARLISRLYGDHIAVIDDPYDLPASFIAISHLVSVGSFFGSIADILVLLALVKLASGIRSLYSGEALAENRVIRIGSLIFAAILGILWVIHFGIQEWDTADGPWYPRAPSLISPQYRDLIGLIGSVLEYLFTLLVLVWAVHVIIRSRTRSTPDVKKAAIYLAVCCALMSLRVTWLICDSAFDFSLVSQKAVFTFLTILYIVFAIWPLAVLFIVLFRLGCRKKLGLEKPVSSATYPDHPVERDTAHGQPWEHVQNY
ncbi:hypothetical protein L249_5159, partial [Ophiocordyceps polyrhachis-furcata BCC 54312]